MVWSRRLDRPGGMGEGRLYVGVTCSWLCMVASGARYQEEINAVGPIGKIECQVPGAVRFWPAHLGAPPVPRMIVNPRAPKGPLELEARGDPALLAAGDRNRSTWDHHSGFAEVVLSIRAAVTLRDA